MSDIEPAKKPHVEQIRWTEKVVLVMGHLFSTKGWEGGGRLPGIMQNRARQPEPALQRVVKQKRAGRRARRLQAATLLPLRNNSDKAQWE